MTVVIPCYRSGATLERAVDSARRQTVPPSEILVIDDGSDDEPTSVALTRIAAVGAGVRVLRLSSNMGPSAARNRGWEEASQPYVAFLDADEAWHPRKLELQMPLMAENGADISGHDISWSASPTIDVRPVQSSGAVSTVSFHQMLYRNRLGTSTVILNAAIPLRFDESMRYSEDYDLWLRVLLTGARCLYRSVPLDAYYKPRFGAGGLSGDLRAMQRGQASIYRRLHSEGVLSTRRYLAVRLWGIARFVRRRVLTAVAKRQGGMP